MKIAETRWVRLGFVCGFCGQERGSESYNFWGANMEINVNSILLVLSNTISQMGSATIQFHYGCYRSLDFNSTVCKDKNFKFKKKKYENLKENNLISHNYHYAKKILYNS